VRDALAERRERCDSERVEDRRAVRVDDALAPAGRAAGEAHRRRLALVELRVFPLVGARGVEQLLVGVLDDEDVLDLGVALQLLQQRQEAAVDDHRAVAAVVGDVGEVARMQPEVEGVQHEPAAGDPEVGLEVLVVVPAERRDPVAALEPELLQGDGELLRPSRHVPIGVAVEALVGQARDDLLVAEEGLRPLQDRGNRELVVHHQAVHHQMPPRVGPTEIVLYFPPLVKACRRGRSRSTSTSCPSRPT
jgi:hypothetical protein